MMVMTMASVEVQSVGVKISSATRSIVIVYIYTYLYNSRLANRRREMHLLTRDFQLLSEVPIKSYIYHVWPLKVHPTHAGQRDFLL
jgi:hypothetical protein